MRGRAGLTLGKRGSGTLREVRNAAATPVADRHHGEAAERAVHGPRVAEAR